MTFGIHVCRGNARTIDSNTGKLVPQWHREGHYDPIAERLFGSLKHDRILLEYDSERAGGFEPLRFVPKDKVIVLGLITTKSSDIESAQTSDAASTRPRVTFLSNSSPSAPNAVSAASTPKR